jgi:DNA-binding winged helix-turn-helix (wHTH) protein
MRSDSNGHASPAASAVGDSRRRYSIGDFVLDTARRELTGPALEQPFRLAPKTQQVLLALIERPGDVLTRDELLQKVWAGTLPTDYVLGQAITQLRKAFGDARGRTPYIETISKSGYRLCVNVVPLDAAAPRAPDTKEAQAGAGAPMPTEPRARRVRWRWLVAVAGLAALLLGYRAWRTGNSDGMSPPALAAERITAQIGDEVDPALSPDAAFVAYAMRADPGQGMAIHLQAAAATTPNLLSKPPAGHHDRSPRWSPDGRKLLFVRIGPTGCRLMQVPASGGPGAVLGDCTGAERAGFDWALDGFAVIAGGMQAGQGNGLRLLDTRSGGWRALEYARPAGTLDFNPRVSPDGKWIGFQRGMSEASLWRVPIVGGEAQQMVRPLGNIQSWTWWPDGASVVVSYFGAQAGVVRVRLRDGHRMELPLADVIDVDAARSGDRLVFSSQPGRLGMSRHRMTARGPSGDPVAVFPSSGSDMQASPSPDGARLAFYSDRTRTVRLWLADLDEPRSLRMVEGLEPLTRHPPAWSADGLSVWVLGKSPTRDGAAATSVIHRVDVASGRSHAVDLAGATPVQVATLGSGALLVVADPGDGRLELQQLDVTANPYRILRRKPLVGDFRLDPQGRNVYYASTDRPGIRRMNLRFVDEMVVDPAVPARYWDRRWLVTPAGVQGVVRTAACVSQWSAPSRQPAVEPRCLDDVLAAGAIVQGVPTSDRAGDWLYLTHALPTTGIDIGMAVLPE